MSDHKVKFVEGEGDMLCHDKFLVNSDGRLVLILLVEPYTLDIRVGLCILRYLGVEGSEDILASC